MLRVILLTVALSLSAVPVTAGPFEDAWAAYDSGDYETTLRLLRRLAEQGDARAQRSLGGMYNAGQGVPQDYAEALKWYRKSAEQGNANAQGNLGVMYDEGKGVPQDDAEAAKWYRKSAEQGNANAQFLLGAMYYTGRGVPQDFVLAHMWYNLAAAQSDEVGKKNRDIAAKSMTPAQIRGTGRMAIYSQHASASGPARRPP